ncbi:hypothetical protein Tco_0412901 [Tanacetum coccineum]
MFSGGLRQRRDSTHLGLRDGPVESEQAPPSPIYVPFVPEPVYSEFLPVDDEIFPAEEQPMPAADSPTHQSRDTFYTSVQRGRVVLILLSWNEVRGEFELALGRQTSRELGYGITDTWDDLDRPFHRRTALLMEEEARVSRAAWAQSMDACDQAADRRRQTVISDLLKADHRRQRQLVEALKIVKSLKTQMIELQRQQGPAKDPAEPELPEEASSSS